MGKWAARLAEKTSVPPQGCTDKTAKRGLVSVLAVTPEGGAGEMRAPTKPGSSPPERPETLDLAAVASTDADIERFNDRRARLLRWGWPEPEAEALAERLVRRDREGEPRVCCLECVSYRPGRCGNHQRAGLLTAVVGRDLAELLQRCPGFQRMR